MYQSAFFTYTYIDTIRELELNSKK